MTVNFSVTFSLDMAQKIQRIAYIRRKSCATIIRTLVKNSIDKVDLEKLENAAEESYMSSKETK